MQFIQSFSNLIILAFVALAILLVTKAIIRRIMKPKVNPMDEINEQMDALVKELDQLREDFITEQQSVKNVPPELFDDLFKTFDAIYDKILNIRNRMSRCTSVTEVMGLLPELKKAQSELDAVSQMQRALMQLTKLMGS